MFSDRKQIKNFSHRHSLTVESMHPLHLIASGKAHRRFSTQAEAESQAKLMKKFSTTSVRFSNFFVKS